MDNIFKWKKLLWDNVNGVNTIPKVVLVWLIRQNILILVDTETKTDLGFKANGDKISEKN